MVISLWLKELSKSSQWFECFTQSLNIVNAVTYSLEIRSYTNNHFFFISTGLKAILGQYEFFTDRNTRDYLAWTTGNGDLMHEVCIPHNIPCAWTQQG